MLEKVKLALRQHTDAFDSEIVDLIAAAKSELILVGILPEKVNKKPPDPLVSRYIVTYCCANFGTTEDYDRLKASYDEQKAQMMSASGYTKWNIAEKDVN